MSRGGGGCVGLGGVEGVMSPCWWFVGRKMAVGDGVGSTDGEEIVMEGGKGQDKEDLSVLMY